ncbi:MAG: DUF3347 domain-containing protein [Bacteroidota bacterium]
MKGLIITILLFLGTQVLVKAQSSVLTTYYGIKNSLVNADANGAAGKAAEFIKSADSLQADPVKDKLIEDAKLISSSTDIVKQRETFSRLSQNLYLLLKEKKLSGTPVYQVYCPMKKKYWLSNEKNIQNPYYGKVMLTCGSITDTINP